MNGGNKKLSAGKAESNNRISKLPPVEFYVLRSILIFELFCFLTLTALSCSAATADEKFLVGIEAYKAAEFERAANAFQESTSMRPAAGAYQNLGLAEWQRGNVGKAVLAWERSLWLNPLDRAVHNNLRFARKAAQIEGPELTWAEVISGWLPVHWWSWILCWSLWVAIGAITLPSALRLPRASWHQILAAFAAMIFLLSLPAQFGLHTRAGLGFVLEKATVLRLTPTSDAQTLAQLAPGEPVRWLRLRGSYILIRTPRATGWVERSQLGFVCDEPSPRRRS
jgi:tetratricopeptide (TPR) repeat protein